MPPRPARRLGVLTTVMLLTLGLLAPTAASASSPGAAAALGPRGSSFDGTDVRALAAAADIEVRDLNAACPPGRVPSSGFRDVPRGSTFARAIDCLLWYDITEGVTETTYAPESFINRRQMAVFLYRMLDQLIILPDVPSSSRFRDLPPPGEARDAILVLSSDELTDLLGVRVVSGTSATTYDPTGRVSRAQMGSFINRVLVGVANYYGSTIEQGHCGDPSRPDVGCFRDENAIPAVHRPNVAALYRIGIVAGRTDGTYGPDASVNRGQMAAFLMRLMDVFVEAEVTVPPDRYADVYVDRGAGATCNPAGRTGTETSPFCTIQAGIAKAQSMQGYMVAVFVEARSLPYTESPVLSSGDAFSVDLLSFSEDYALVDGTVRIDGDSARDANGLFGFSIEAGPGAPAVDVRTSGAAIVLVNELIGATAVRVDQSGATQIVLNDVVADDVGVDLVRTVYGSAEVLANYFEPVTTYVRAPAGTSSPDGKLNAWRAENDFATGTRLVTVDGRRAIVPS